MYSSTTITKTIKASAALAVTVLMLLLTESHAAGVETIYISKSKASLTKSKSKNITIIKTGIFANRKPAVEIPDGKRWTQLKANDCLCVYGQKREIESINYDHHHKRYVIRLFKFEEDRTLAACESIRCQ